VFGKSKENVEKAGQENKCGYLDITVLGSLISAFARYKSPKFNHLKKICPPWHGGTCQ
jgi:hypothetical protein